MEQICHVTPAVVHQHRIVLFTVGSFHFVSGRAFLFLTNGKPCIHQLGGIHTGSLFFQLGILLQSIIKLGRIFFFLLGQLLQRTFQCSDFFLHIRNARIIGTVQRTKQKVLFGFQFLDFLGQLGNTAGKVMQLGYLIERRFLFLRKQIFPFLGFRLNLLHQTCIAFKLRLDGINTLTESRKLELFRKFNAGDIRILIGSTFKLGIGANVQERLKAIHHLDVPWRPADMIQREGRILRRGNQNKNVIIYRYITESSFDSYSWQILETKQRFITQFLTGTTYQRSIEDLENQVLTYAQVKALALAEPLMKQLAEKENEVKNLKILLSRERQTLAEQKKELAQIDEKIEAARQRWETSIAAADALKKYDADARKNAYQRIKSLLTDDFLTSGSALQMPMVLGMGMELPKRQDEKKPYILLKYAEQKYSVSMGDTPAGNAHRVINALKDFQKLADKDKEHLDKVVSRKEELQSLVRSPDHSYSDQLAACEKEASRLREQIAVRAECGAFTD